MKEIVKTAIGTALGIALFVIVTEIYRAISYDVSVWYNCLGVAAGALGC